MSLSLAFEFEFEPKHRPPPPTGEVGWGRYQQRLLAFFVRPHPILPPKGGGAGIRFHERGQPYFTELPPGGLG